MADLRPSLPRSQIPSVLQPNVHLQSAEIDICRATDFLKQNNDVDIEQLYKQYGDKICSRTPRTLTPTPVTGTSRKASSVSTSAHSEPVYVSKRSGRSHGIERSASSSNSTLSTRYYPSVRSASTSKAVAAPTVVGHGLGHGLVAPLSLSPDLLKEARRAKEALGMTPHAQLPSYSPSYPAPRPLPPLPAPGPLLKSEIISSLPSVVVDICFYNPFGTFIIPCHDLTITSSMNFRSLITSLQLLLDEKVKIQDFAKGPLLISFIQVKIFNGGKYTGFPNVGGALGGKKVVHPKNESVKSPSSSAANLGHPPSMYDKRDGDEETPCAETVKWVVGPGSEFEEYWEQYRIAMQTDVVKWSIKGRERHSGAAQEVYKKPMIKVMTVLKVGLLGLFVGAHTFLSVDEMPKEDQTTGKGKGKEGVNDELIGTIQEKIEQKHPDLGIGETEIDFAIEFAKGVNLGGDEKQNTMTMAKQVTANLKKSGRQPLRELTPKSSKEDLPRARKPEHNWGFYQRIGGDPEMHRLFPLDHVPFTFTSSAWEPKEEGESDDGNEGKENKDLPDTPPVEMVPYRPLGPELIKMIIQDRFIIENTSEMENKDMAAGFDQADDDKYLQGTLSPVKPARPTSSPAEPFPAFHLPNHNTSSPAQHLANDPVPSHLGSHIEDILNVVNNGYDTPAFNGLFQNFSSTTAANPSPTPCSPSPTMNYLGTRNNNIPPQNRSSSPPSNLFTLRNNNISQRSVADSASLSPSFSAFNSAAHEVQSQSHSRGFYNMSPTRTHAQMSRAFNSPTVTNFTTTSAQPQNYQGSRPMEFRNMSPTRSHASTPFNPTSSNNPGTVFNLAGQSQGQSNPQAQGQSISHQFPTLDSSGSSQGTSAFYNGVILGTPSPSTFNIGAGTSRGWSGNGATTTAHNARPSGSYHRRPLGGASQLRADSPSFQSGASGTPPARALPVYLRGVHGQVPASSIQQMSVGGQQQQRNFQNQASSSYGQYSYSAGGHQ